MNENNAAVAKEVLAAIANFLLGKGSIEDVQIVLQSTTLRFENDGSGIARVVSLAEADLEEVRFTVRSGAQRMAAHSRLEKLRKEIASTMNAPAD